MFKSQTQIKILTIFLLFVFLITAGLGCKTPSQDVQQATQPVTLKFWRVWDDNEDFSEIIAAYQAAHPYVNIEYRRFRYEEYEQALVEALAEDRGPDIFSISNTWVNRYLSKIAPLPDQTTMPYISTVKHLGIQEETVVEMKSKKSITPRGVREKFADVVGQDVIWQDPETNQEKVWGLPLSVDTLALFYNIDLLNNAGIPEPARTWVEFQDHVKKIVKQDKKGNITQAGAALGTADNVVRSFDILSLLMMQNGTQMNAGNSVIFNSIPDSLKGREMPPGEEALIFYTDFAYPAKEVYTWNEEMPSSLDAFIQGQVAYFFGYAYHLTDITNRAPKLRFNYKTMPQIEGNPEINFANYWIETVSKKSANTNIAWDFIQFATSAEQVKSYLDKTERPTALKELISTQINDEAMAPFASQLLTAKSWYRGRDYATAEKLFKDMITAVVKAQMTVPEAIDLAASRIQQTM
ncbi:MAG: extracellular solute-binding protein [Patescibacteria group bacterium]